MLDRTRRFVPAFAALGYGALALAAQPTTEDLQAKIDALEHKVQALEAKQVSLADVDATVQRVLDDSQRRSQLLAAEGFTAGYNKGKFIIQSADGNFVLNPTLQFQPRYIASYADEAKDNGDGETTDGFEIRRMKFGFAGNVVSKDLTYKFQWATLRNNGAEASVYLEDAWVRYSLGSGWALFGGQFEDPWAHETLVSSSRQLAVEQSYVGTFFDTDYVQGLGVAYEMSQARVQLAFTDGANSDNTSYATSPFDFGVAARGELMLSGDNWKQYDDFSAIGNKADLLVLGAGASWNQSGDADVLYHGVDAQWEPQGAPGLSLFASMMGRYTRAEEDSFGPGQDDSYVYGVVAQAGYMLTTKWEVFGRYDILFLDEDLIPEDSQDTVQEYTLGVNYYINGHAAKFTADVVLLPEGSPSSFSGLGIVASPEEFQAVARVQFQLLL